MCQFYKVKGYKKWITKHWTWNSKRKHVTHLTQKQFRCHQQSLTFAHSERHLFASSWQTNLFYSALFVFSGHLFVWLFPRRINMIASSYFVCYDIFYWVSLIGNLLSFILQGVFLFLHFIKWFVVLINDLFVLFDFLCNFLDLHQEK